ncbi:hypothetical protein [Ruminococcus sp.]|uniref:DUF1700 domain-containing protein n=1 Tax=Ruminococcus sp. TaxID=41978 RepID=UPI0025F27916|nr:hypothetical protein [Ruminococcus sp.]MBQ8967120.1 hypothetical protein [Ruminococcus sp.]
MNRLEFLTSLRYNLEKGGLPREDIEDALSYYEEIFLDSGYGSDEQTANMLGSPDELAREILIDNGIHPDGDAAYQVGEAKQRPYGNFKDVDFEEVDKDKGNAQGGYNYGYGYNGNNNSGNQGNMGAAFENVAHNFGKAVDGVFNTAKTTFDRTFNDPSMTAAQKSKRNNTILKVLILVLSAPLWISILGGIAGIIVSILAGLFSLIVAIVAGGFSLLAGGISQLFSAPPIGLMMIGGGLILMGIFGLVAKPGFKGIFKLIKLIVDACKALLKKITE